ncbi:MAG: carboxymuconolactone decarboxylase family protein [Actinophytocola sp.]|uniref:carboxymuconolactone decarboxylase family protein n=1 Tax=Actinophytocola sp. TaxID=1872138 RepID=UPI00132B71C7|nr:hypothetical protein [Actinophytocola sp.]MPZ82408.1 carboxymuconolactone decarboxylase family protein [Actinophytocola sp.]
MTPSQTFTVHTLDSAPSASRPVLAELEQRIGFIPNLAATMAGSPVLIGGFGQLQQTLRATTLTGAEREVVGLAVSHENDCPYSLAAPAVFAAGQGAAPDVILAARSGRPLPDARSQALRKFAVAVLRDRGRAPVDAFLTAGYTVAQAYEVITQVGYTSIANWAANLCDTPIDDAFQSAASS